MNCIHCHGQMKRSAAPFHVDRNGYHLVFDTVPAWVCANVVRRTLRSAKLMQFRVPLKGSTNRLSGLVQTFNYECR